MPGIINLYTVWIFFLDQFGASTLFARTLSTYFDSSFPPPVIFLFVDLTLFIVQSLTLPYFHNHSGNLSMLSINSCVFETIYPSLSLKSQLSTKAASLSLKIK